MINNSFVYSCFKDDTFIGVLCYFLKDNKRFVCAFGNRKHHLENLEILKESLTWFSSDIYAETSQRLVRLLLLKSGFKKINDNTFIYERR